MYKSKLLIAVIVAMNLASAGSPELAAQQTSNPGNNTKPIDLNTAKEVDLSIDEARAVQIAFNGFFENGYKVSEFGEISIEAFGDRVYRVTFLNKTDTGLLGSPPNFPDWEFYVDVVVGKVLYVHQSM